MRHPLQATGAFQALAASRKRAWTRWGSTNGLGPGHGIFLVWSGAYRTHEGVCEQIVVRLSALRPNAHVVQARPNRFFENAELHRFQPR